MIRPIPKTILPDGSGFDMSVSKQIDRMVDVSYFSLKYVIKGEEHYRFKGRDHKVKSGQFLAVNDQPGLRIIIDSKDDVQGLCLGFSFSLMNEIVSFLPDTAAPDYFSAYLRSSGFFDHVYGNGQSTLPAWLQQSAEAISHKHTDSAWLEDFFWRMAEKVVADQLKAFQQLSSVNAKKLSSKKDIYRRLLDAKDHMDGCLYRTIKIEDAAAVACMSEYHFYRLFRSSFGVTPYNYMLHKRIAWSKELLQRGMQVSQVALEAGFADIFSFSKAFKKQEGLSPQHFIPR